jgi:hypothetical protein
VISRRAFLVATIGGLACGKQLTRALTTNGQGHACRPDRPATITDHAFVGRRFPEQVTHLKRGSMLGPVMPLDRERLSCGQSCGRCGHQWYEHTALAGDRVTAFAIALADLRARQPSSDWAYGYLAQLSETNIYLRRDMAVRTLTEPK